MALAQGMPARRESQEICFLTDGNYRTFIRDRLGEDTFRPGDFVDIKGKVLGRHLGLIHYTVGQRRGLNLPAREPYYVLALDPTANRVVIGPKVQTRRRQLTVREIIWQNRPSDPKFEALVQIRSRHRPAQALVHLLSPDRAEVVFHEPQTSIAAGQAAVFYRGRQVLGGGWIERSSFGLTPGRND